MIFWVVDMHFWARLLSPFILHMTFDDCKFTQSDKELDELKDAIYSYTTNLKEKKVDVRVSIIQFPRNQNWFRSVSVSISVAVCHLTFGSVWRFLDMFIP